MPVSDGLPLETGDFQEDGVAFASAEIVLEFIEDAHSDAALLPTGNVVDSLDIPGIGRIEATLLTAGNPTIFIDAAALGLSGNELPEVINTDSALLTIGAIRHGDAGWKMKKAILLRSARVIMSGVACICPNFYLDNFFG